MKSELYRLLTQVVAGRVGDTIVVCGPPRSGTTWLAELLRECPGRYKLLNEPPHVGWNSRAREAGFDGRTRINRHENRPALEAYVRDALKGNVELGPSWHFRHETPIGKLFEHVTHQRLVVKFCRAGRMLHWLADRFPVRQLVVIIRHPCAVIASMLNMGDNWQPRNMEGQSLTERFGESIPDHIVEKLTARVITPGSSPLMNGSLPTGWTN